MSTESNLSAVLKSVGDLRLVSRLAEDAHMRARFLQSACASYRKGAWSPFALTQFSSPFVEVPYACIKRNSIFFLNFYRRRGRSHLPGRAVS